MVKGHWLYKQHVQGAAFQNCGACACTFTTSCLSTLAINYRGLQVGWQFKWAMERADSHHMYIHTCIHVRICVELKMADKQIISVTVNNESASSSATNQQVRSRRQLVTITPLSGYRPPAHVAVPQASVYHVTETLSESSIVDPCIHHYPKWNFYWCTILRSKAGWESQ